MNFARAKPGDGVGKVAYATVVPKGNVTAHSGLRSRDRVPFRRYMSKKYNVVIESMKIITCMITVPSKESVLNLMHRICQWTGPNYSSKKSKVSFVSKLTSEYNVVGVTKNSILLLLGGQGPGQSSTIL